MSALTAAVGGITAFHLAGNRGWRKPSLAAVAVAAMIAEPRTLPVVTAFISASIVTRRVRRSRARRRAVAADVAMFSRLLLVAVSGGLPVVSALDSLSGEVGTELASDLRGRLRRTQIAGGASIADGEGPARRLLLVVARAQATGSPVTEALRAYVANERQEEHAAAIAGARRMPVRLMVPLTLLILPGFVLMTVGPWVLSAFRGLVTPVLP